VAIKKVDLLRTSIKNLWEEIHILLDEEKTRHGRCVDQIRVEFQLETTSLEKGKREAFSGTEPFDMAKFHVLPEAVLQYFLNLPGFNPKNFRVTKLGFLLKDFRSV
jgi:hypothetical protein